MTPPSRGMGELGRPQHRPPVHAPPPPPAPSLSTCFLLPSACIYLSCSGVHAALRAPNKALQFLHTVGLFLVTGGCRWALWVPPKPTSRGGVPLRLEALLTPELDLALGGGEQAGQGGVEGERLHHATAHCQAEHQ